MWKTSSATIIERLDTLIRLQQETNSLLREQFQVLANRSPLTSRPTDQPLRKRTKDDITYAGANSPTSPSDKTDPTAKSASPAPINAS